MIRLRLTHCPFKSADFTLVRQPVLALEFCRSGDNIYFTPEYAERGQQLHLKQEQAVVFIRSHLHEELATGTPRLWAATLGIQVIFIVIWLGACRSSLPSGRKIGIRRAASQHVPPDYDGGK